MKFSDRLAHGWNAFMNKDPTCWNRGSSGSTNPARPMFTHGNEKSIATAVYNRMAVDAAAVKISHCKLDKNKRYLEDIDSNLNECLNVSANIDQTGRDFRQDIFMTMLDEGVTAIVPVDTDIYSETGSFDILSVRTGKIVEWFPQDVKVRVYNEKTGKHEEVFISKKVVSICTNPFFAIMNEPNSTMQRLIRKLNLSDLLDEKTGSNRLDLIVQLPYSVRTDLRKAQAEERLKNIEMQLSTSNLGIAYIDSTEHVTQLNRAVENNLMRSIEYLTDLFFSQLGITNEILNGTADDKAMNNYYSRIIEPLLSTVCDSMNRTFLTKTARSQGQSITFFRDPFKLIPVSEIAEIADKFTRNEILTSNEVRQIVGMKPVDDPRADELRNKNLSEAKGEEHINVQGNDINRGQTDPQEE